MLARQLFSIDPARDTSLKTLHGTLIRIPAGAFSATAEVEVEIREAFTPAEILAAGLTTESNGRPLRSGGMIYINAMDDDDTVQPVKPLNVSIPSSYYDTAMQVFKGEQTDSAGINWVDPQPTDTTPQSKQWRSGKALFQSRCASCHNIFTDLTGPALGGVENRWSDRSKLHLWIRNWPKAVESGYPRAVTVQHFSASEMVLFEGALTGAQIENILFYIRNEYNNPTSGGCTSDTVPLTKSERTYLAPGIDAATTDTSLLNKDYGLPDDGMYDFQVKSLGWFNVDAYIDGYAGVINAKVGARLKGLEARLHVYLFCPADKVLISTIESNGNTYIFNKVDGRIPLIEGRRAILFAFGNHAGKLYYGISEFTITKEQTIDIRIKETNDEEMRTALQSKQLDGIDLGIEKLGKKVLERNCERTYSIIDSTSGR